jgi:hypothetical protein
MRHGVILGTEQRRDKAFLAGSTSFHLGLEFKIPWPISGSRWRGGKAKVYTDGKEDAAARQERQVPVKARKSWNELMRAMI